MYKSTFCYCILLPVEQALLLPSLIDILGIFLKEAITEKDKESLQNIMAYGRDKQPTRATKKKVIIDERPEVEIDRFEEGGILKFIGLLQYL